MLGRRRFLGSTGALAATRPDPRSGPRPWRGRWVRCLALQANRSGIALNDLLGQEKAKRTVKVAFTAFLLRDPYVGNNSSDKSVQP